MAKLKRKFRGRCRAECGAARGRKLLNDEYRNGGDLVDDRESGRDCISEMRLAHKRADVLANALRDMGITESGDAVRDDE